MEEEAVVITEDQLNIFSKPARILIGGYSSSGKTFFTLQLLEKYGSLFDNVIICGLEPSELKSKHSNISFKTGLYDPFIDDDLQGKTLMIVDDLMDNKHYLKVVAKVFSKGRHKKISCIFISQNLYLQDQSYRTISLNASHFVLFKCRDISQISHFARTFIEKEKQSNFISCYRKHVLEKDYGYIIIDFDKKHNSPLLIRTDLFSDNFELCIKL